MENKDLPAFPVECSYMEDGQIKGNQTGNTTGFEKGLSKREYIAAMIDVSKDMEDYSAAFFKELMGRDIPNAALEKYKYWAECEAMMRLIKADALIAELSKPQP